MDEIAELTDATSFTQLELRIIELCKIAEGFLSENSCSGIFKKFSKGQAIQLS